LWGGGNRKTRPGEPLRKKKRGKKVVPKLGERILEIPVVERKSRKKEKTLSTQKISKGYSRGKKKEGGLEVNPGVLETV